LADYLYLRQTAVVKQAVETARTSVPLGGHSSSYLCQQDSIFAAQDRSDGSNRINGAVGRSFVETQSPPERVPSGRISELQFRALVHPQQRNVNRRSLKSPQRNQLSPYWRRSRSPPPGGACLRSNGFIMNHVIYFTLTQNAKSPPKIGVPEDNESFPDFAIEFPVTAQKFPVRVRREFRRNSLLLFLYFAVLWPLVRPNGQNSLYFPS
jgi:hypothetical protein